MSALQLLGELRRLGISVRAEGEELRCRAARGVLTPALLEELRRRKPEILACLAEAGATAPAALAPIPRVPHGADLPLSFGQQRLWLLDRLTPGDPSYNVFLAAAVDGRLDVDALRRTLALLVARHEPLRTVFAETGGVPRQVIMPAAEVPLPCIDITGVDPGDRDAAIEEVAREHARRPFNLETGPLFRPALVRAGETRHVLLISMHHIVADGWSVAVLVRELAALYTASVAGVSPDVPDLSIQYADYAAWQRQHLSGAALKRLEDYWRRQLSGQPTSLPLGRRATAGRVTTGTKHPFALPPVVAERLLALSGHEGARLFTTLMTALYVLLSRYTGERDLAIGFPIANRTHPQTEPLIGFFANTLVLRQRLRGNPTFRELLRQVRDSTLDAFTHQDMPFDYLTEILRPERDLARNPLFSVLFALQQAWLPSIEFGGITLTPLDVDNRTAKFDLNVTLSEQSGTLQGWIQYRDDLFEPSEAARMAGHLCTLLENATADPDARIQSLSMLTGEERRELLALSASASIAAEDTAIHEMFEAHARRTPARVALRCGDTRLTYSELNERAQALSARLRALGVGPEVPVAICLERSIHVITAILATWKAGGAYLPLDPSLPRERLALMLQDAQPRVVITSSRLAGELPSLSFDTVRLDSDSDAPAVGSGTPVRALTDSLAYLMYTSGSTGAPKAVAIEHRSLSNLVRALDDAVYVGLGPAPLAIGLNGPFGFDTSVKQIAQLGRGHTLHLLPDRLRSDPYALIAALRDQPLDVLDCTPSQLRLLLEAGFLDEPRCSSTTLLIGGEAIDADLWTRLAEASRCTSFNLYGPTECTVDATTCRIRAAAAPAIGRALPNVRAYVVGGGVHPAPAGVAGELYLGGCGVGRGYYRRPALTAESFVPDPFAVEPGARMYRTRDVARWLPSGDLEFVGRADRLVKVRGHRIELEEVEGALRAHPAVAQAAVLVTRAPRGDERLVAYVCAAAGVRPGRLELIRFLRSRLAGPIPSEFAWLDALPLNEHGKADYRRLAVLESPAPETRQAGREPRDLFEYEIVRAWESVLGTRQVQVTDNFFDLGGHSLLAVLAVSGIRQRLGVDVPVAALFEHPTVEQLAAALRLGNVSLPSPVVALQPDGSKAPFFCVHPVGGGVLCYVELARALGNDRPFYAFQSEYAGPGQPARSVEALARRYVDQMRAIQADGPYCIGGWSFGGMVAFEMSRQLAEAGQQVAFLALLDTRAPVGPRDARPIAAPELLKGFAAELGGGTETGGVLLTTAIDNAAGGDPVRPILDAAIARGLLPPDVDEAHVRRLLGLFETHVNASRSYLPRSADLAAILVQSEASAAKWGREWEIGWRTLATRGTICHVVQGNHYSMMKPPHVEAVARILAAALEQATRNERSIEAATGHVAPAI